MTLHFFELDKVFISFPALASHSKFFPPFFPRPSGGAVVEKAPSIVPLRPPPIQSDSGDLEDDPTPAGPIHRAFADRASSMESESGGGRRASSSHLPQALEQALVRIHWNRHCSYAGGGSAG